MNKYQLIEAVLLKVSDLLTTTRLGLADGRIVMEDCVDNFLSAKLAMAQLEVIAVEGDVENMSDDRQNLLQRTHDTLKLG